LNILINGQRIDFETEGEKTVGEILGAMEGECEKSGLTVTGVRVDGVDVAAADMDALFGRDADTIGDIELSTMSGKEVRGMITALGTRFAGHSDQLVEVPVLLQTGKDMRVMETINALSNDLYELYQLLPLMPLAGIDGGGPEVGDVALTDIPSSLSPLLKDLLGALESKDTILVGDLSEYELAPRIRQLGTALSSISR
jgi:hypothetical protein